MEMSSERNLEQHIPIVGWLFIVLNALGLLVAIFVFFIVILGGVVSGDEEAIAITSVVASAVCGLILLFTLPGLIAGIGLLRRRAWSRALAIVMGFISLLNFPFGTALGIYTLYALLPQDATMYFTNKRIE